MSTRFLPSCYQLVLQFVLAGLDFLLLWSRRSARYQTHLSGLGREDTWGKEASRDDEIGPVYEHSIRTLSEHQRLELLLTALPQTGLSLHLEVVPHLSAVKNAWNSTHREADCCSSFWSSSVSFLVTRFLPRYFCCFDGRGWETVGTGL